LGRLRYLGPDDKEDKKKVAKRRRDNTCRRLQELVKNAIASARASAIKGFTQGVILTACPTDLRPQLFNAGFRRLEYDAVSGNVSAHWGRDRTPLNDELASLVKVYRQARKAELFLRVRAQLTSLLEAGKARLGETFVLEFTVWDRDRGRDNAGREVELIREVLAEFPMPIQVERFEEGGRAGLDLRCHCHFSGSF
jgi:hypothetical protein